MPDADHPLVELPQLVHERGEVAVARADHEGGDVLALERHLQRVDRQLDVGGVLARGAHPLRDLDQLDVMTGQGAPVLVEVGPVRVGLACDHPPAFGEGVQHRSKIELHAPQVVAGADRQVLVVQEQGDPFFEGIHLASA